MGAIHLRSYDTMSASFRQTRPDRTGREFAFPPFPVTPWFPRKDFDGHLLPIHPGFTAFLVAIVQNPRESPYVLRCVIPIADTLLFGNGLVSAGFVGEDSPRVKAPRALASLTAGSYSVPAAFPAGFSWNLQEKPQVVQSRADGRTDLMKSGAP